MTRHRVESRLVERVPVPARQPGDGWCAVVVLGWIAFSGWFVWEVFIR
jgi:hypothetical protein